MQKVFSQIGYLRVDLLHLRKLFLSVFRVLFLASEFPLLFRKFLFKLPVEPPPLIALNPDIPYSGFPVSSFVPRFEDVSMRNYKRNAVKPPDLSVQRSWILRDGDISRSIPVRGRRALDLDFIIFHIDLRLRFWYNNIVKVLCKSSEVRILSCEHTGSSCTGQGETRNCISK